jgi:putative membrane protein
LHNWHETFGIYQIVYHIKIYKMQKRLLIATGISIILFSCNDTASDSVEKADSANEAKMDSSTTGIIKTDEASTNFLVDAANGGMAEIRLGEIAAQKATNPKVKEYASMLVHDHSGANDQVKALAAARNVTLPTSPSEEKQKIADDLLKKSSAAFDRAYMKEMVDDHEADIRKFESASNKVNDADVKAFVDNTLPKLRMHLDSAKAIQKALK